ncbi:MAG: competence protein ComEC [Parcubacteria group bacterium Gr01-1014_30]|nr:MAG: competence protein ComEC [Parcubacteria group bacterium Gr01-1014_30]
MRTLSSPHANALVWGSKVVIVCLFLLLLAWIGAAEEEKVDINTASSEELQKIKWVGPVIAHRIIEARPFYSIDELIKVNGIGEKRLADIKAQGLAWADPNMQPPSEPPPPPPPPPKPQTQTATEQETFTTANQETTLESTQNTPPPAPPQPNSSSTATKPVQPSKEPAPLRVDINAASAEELQKLAGVGQVLAQRIIDVRPFYSLDDLAKVQGIGEKTLQDIKSQGLAWVDPALKPPKIENEKDLPETGLAQAAQPFELPYSNQETKERLPVFLIAFLLAGVSGTAILLFKNKLKNTHNHNKDV